MLTITDLLNQNRDDVNAVVDLTDKKMKVEPDRYTPFFPRANVADESIVLAKFTGNGPRMVQILAEGQEPVATRSRATVSTAKLTDFRMGFKHDWTLADKNMMRRLNESQNASIRQEVTMHFLTTIAQRIRDLNWTGDRLCNILSINGFVDYLDPITERRVRMDYTPDMNLTVQTPAPLTGAAQWNNPTTARPLSDIRRWSENYHDSGGTGEYPSSAQMSYGVSKMAKETNEVKFAVQRLRGYSTDLLSTYDTDPISDAELRSVVLKWGNIPESPNAFMIDDKIITQEQASGEDSNTPFFSDQNGNSNYVRFGFDGPIVEQMYVPVPENEWRSGIYTKTYKEEGRMSYSEWFGGLANMIPVIRDPRKLFATKVAN